MTALELVRDVALVLAGGGVAVVADWLRGRRERAERRMETVTARAEELCEQARSLYDWAKVALDAALAGRFEPLPGSVLRMGTLIAVYMPEVKAESEALAKTADRMQQACAALSREVRKGGPRSEGIVEEPRTAWDELVRAVTALTDAVGTRLRAIREK